MSKFFLRSRRILAALAGMTPLAVTLLTAAGVPVPEGLAEPLAGFAQSLVGSITSGLVLWSTFRPDNAELTPLPHSANAPLGGLRG